MSHNFIPQIHLKCRHISNIVNSSLSIFCENGTAEDVIHIGRALNNYTPEILKMTIYNNNHSTSENVLSHYYVASAKVRHTLQQVSLTHTKSVDH